MLKYTLKRILMAIPVILGIVTIVFVLMRVFSSNPAYLLLGQRASAERVAELTSYLGLDQPIWKQYVIYLGQMLQGDFGDSLFSGLPVMQEIGERLPATIELALFSVLIASVLGVSLGVICAVKQNSALDRICQVGGLVGVSLPKFWLGLMLIILFAVNLGWLPVSGRFDFMNRPETITGFMILDSIITGNWAALGSTLRYMLLPGVSIAIASVGTIMRYTRSTMLETIRQDYIRTARAKGLSERKVVYHHAFRNTLIPLVTIVGGSLPGLFSGALITETLYSINGIGYVSYQSMTAGDIPFSMFYLSFLAVLTLAGNLISDILYAVVDPRVRIA